MSSLFSIGEDELDLDDEDCILAAACGIGSSINRITDNSKNNLDSKLNQSSFTAQLLRTKEVEKLKSSSQRWPFEYISNIKTCDRAHDKKRTSSEQLHKCSSFINWQKNSITSQSVTNGLNVPATKRFAIDKTCTSSSKQNNSANCGNLLQSSSIPAFNADGKELAYSSLKTYPCNSSPPVERNSLTRDSQIQELAQCSFTHSNYFCESSKRVNPSRNISTPSASKSDSTGLSKQLPRKELSGLCEISFNGCKTLNQSKPVALHANSPVWQQKQALAGSAVINVQTGDCSTPISNTTTVSKRQSTNNFKKNKIETRDLESTTVSIHRANTVSRAPQTYKASNPSMNRQSGGIGPRMPQSYQAVTSSVNRQSGPAGSKTPQKSVTPGTNRQRSGAAPRTPQGYQAVTPGVNRQSGSTGSRTPQECQTVTPGVNRNLARTPSSSRTPKTRKFPGPAGLLPKLSPGQNLEDAAFVSPLPTTKKPSPVQSKVSQASTSEDDDFSQDPWTYMYQDFVKNVPLAMRYTIIRIYTEAIQQTLDHGKVPCLCALVKAFSLTEADASVLLKDPTGEIHGTLHRKVLENYQTELAPGAGLLLKHVSVFSPAPRKHYLNITPGNILQIYPPDPQNITSSQPLASQCTQVERQQEKQSCYIEPNVDEVDCNKQQCFSTEEDPWNQKDCFADLLEGLDDDEDLLDEALLV